MRILVLCHRFPYPPNKGDRIRSYQIIRHLAEKHEVSVLSFLDRRVSPAELTEFGSLCHKVEGFPLSKTKAMVRGALGILAAKPLTHSFFFSRDLAGRAADLVNANGVDLVIVCGTAMAPLVERMRGVPRILDIVDVDSAKWGQYARFARLPWAIIYRQEERRLRSYESSLGTVFDRVIATTQQEVELLRAIVPEISASVVRNGVDFDLFSPTGEVPRSSSPCLVFTGQMDYFANVDGVANFAARVFPELRKTYPDLEFLIVGRSPTLKVRNLARLDGVTVTGEVEEVLPYLLRAWVFVAPLRIAQGVQNKVLEALSAGLPAVVSEQVMKGLADLGLEEGEHLLVGRTEEELESSVRRLLDDDALRSTIADRGRRHLSETCSWSESLRHLDALIGELKGAYDGCSRQPSPSSRSLHTARSRS